jgi:GTP-binding protein
MYTIVIAGNANVGKSTLFNRLVVHGADRSIAHDMPGVTRDYKIAEAKLGKLRFNLIDTAGFNTTRTDDLSRKVKAQTNTVIAEADLIVFVVDGRVGLTSLDKSLYALLRKKNIPIIVAINKCDDRRHAQDILNEFASLSNPDICAISAEHNIGLKCLYELAARHLEVNRQKAASAKEIDIEQSALQKPIRIAILGRPNVGKSTLINAFLGEDRLLASADAGTTRDSISIDLKRKGRDIIVLDTAGVRHKRKVQETVEQLSVRKCIQAIELCHVAVLLVDINNPLEQQDLKIADLVHKRMKPLVVVVNKVDSIKHDKEQVQDIEFVVRRKLSQGRDVPILYVSALLRKNIYKVLDECIKLYEKRGARISTSELNAWLKGALEAHQLPLSGAGRRLKIKFMNQVKAYPPTFQIFMSNPDALPDSYLKYLIGSMKSHFKDLSGSIAIKKTKAKNPYLK